MTKLLGLILLVLGDGLLIRYFSDRKKKPVQCLWEMIGFLGSITYGVTEWKRTLEKAILYEKNQGVFPKLFQEKFLFHRKNLPLREALQKALEHLPLPREATEVLSQYFSHLGKTTPKTTEERYQHTKLRLEELLNRLRNELPKSQKLISTGVYAISATIAVLFV